MKKAILFLLMAAARVAADDVYGETLTATDQPAAVVFKKCATKTTVGTDKAGSWICAAWEPGKFFGSMAVRVTNLGTEVGYAYVGGGPIPVLPGKHVTLKATGGYGIPSIAIAAEKGKQTRLHVFASNPVQLEP